MFASVFIKSDGTLCPEDDSRMRDAFIFSAGNFRVWFVTTLNFLENGNDYIVDFGKLEKVTTARMTYDCVAVQNIKSSLEGYFLGPDSAYVLEFQSVSELKPTCKGVHFEDGWIRIAKTSRWHSFKSKWKL